MSRSKPAICFYCADQNPHRDKSLGITNYTYGLLENLNRSRQVDLRAVTSRSSAGVPNGISTKELPFRTDHIVGRLASDHFHPFIIGGEINADLWHYPKGFLPFGMQVRPRKVGTMADTILQFYADHYPNHRSTANYAYWIAMLKNAVRRLDLILTVSEYSKKAILEFATRHRIKEPKITVTYEGVSVEGVSDEPKGDYVLHLASEHPHKRTTWLLQEWQRLQSVGEALPKLRLVGRLDAMGRRMLANLKDVELLPALERQNLLQAVQKSLALILPSEIEGFGLPALEAYCCRTPVVYVKGTAVEEVLGVGSAGGFEFENGSFVVALAAALTINPQEVELKRAELRERFAWSTCVHRTLQAYRDACERSPLS